MDRHHFFGIQQWMAGLFDVDDAVGIEYRLGALIIFGIFRLGKNEIQCGENLLVLLQISGAAGGLGAQSLENLLDLRLLLHIKFLDLVIQLYYRHRLDKQCGTGGRLVVNHSLEGILVFRLHRHTVTAVSHGDEGVLQDSLIALRINDGRQLIMNGDIGLLDLLADIPQRGGSVVADLIRRQDAAGDALVQKLQRLQHIKVSIQAVKGHVLVLGHAVFFHLSGDGEKLCDIQKLLGCQRGVNLQQPKVWPDIGQTLKR